MDFLVIKSVLAKNTFLKSLKIKMTGQDHFGYKTITTYAGKNLDLMNIARANAMNRTGYLDYNRYGKKDGQGFQECSKKFIDNFLLRTIVPDYLTKKRCYTKVGSLNKAIREELEEFGIRNYTMKAVNNLYCVRITAIPEKMLDLVRERDLTKENGTTKYFWQDIKVACPNEDPKLVLSFLQQRKYASLKVQLKDIDFTLDFAGSFDKDEVIQHMLQTSEFRMERDEEVPFGRTIMDNDKYVGRNCLSYMDTSPGGCSVRCKLYNKMVQMLESKAVAKSLGNNWRKWVDQSMKDHDTGGRKDTRLVDAKEKASNRGLTRAEVTFNCGENIPSEKDMDFVLHQITTFVPNFLVYSTPFSATWRAYCDSFVHSLVVVERGPEKERALIVHSYNDLTKKVSGWEIENWDKVWCLANLTFSSEIPIDLIEVNFINDNEESGKHTYGVTMSRWMKQHPKGEVFKTRLVSDGSMYSSSLHSEEECQRLVEKAGLVPHKNCIIELANTRCNRKSKADIQLKFLEAMSPTTIKQIIPDNKTNDRLNMIKQETLDKMKNIREKMKVSLKVHQEISATTHMTKKLKDLKTGDYPVWALKVIKSKTKLGVRYILLLQQDGQKIQAYSNTKIEETLQRLVPVHIMELLSTDKVLHAKNENDGPIGKLTITGYGRTTDYKPFAYCRFGFSVKMLEDISTARKLLQEYDSSKSLEGNVAAENENETLLDATYIEPEETEVEETTDLKVQKRTIQDLPMIPKNELPLFHNIPELSVLTKNSVHTLKRAHIFNYYGQERLLVELDDGNVYVAGHDLEEKEEQLHLDCKIILQKHRVCRSKRRKYYVCKVVKKGDWVGLVNYTETPMLQQKKIENIRVVDVGYTEHKGIKRKIIMTEDGTVFRVKKSKIGDEIRPGSFI